MKKRSIIVGIWIQILVAGVAYPQSSGDTSGSIVRSIHIEGNESTKDFVILREMSTSIGDTLDREKIEFDKDRIYSLGLFNRVEIEYMNDESAVDVVVRVHERWYIYPFPIIGFKYRDPKKLYYGFGLAHTNFRGRNEKVAVSFAVGYDRWVELIYQNPKLTSDDDIFLRVSTVSAQIQNLNPDRGTYRQSHHAGSVTLGKRFGLYSLLTGRIGYEVWQVSEAGAGRTISPDGRDAFASLGFNYSVDKRDIREYATQGYFWHLSVTKAGLGNSSIDFLRYGYEGTAYVPLVGGTVLGARTYGQFTAGGPVPVYNYTYFGHDERIRGYFNDVFEGENIAGGNLELRIPILSPRYYEFTEAPMPEFSVWRYALYAGIFADAGKTWFRSEGFAGRKWYSGFGAGLHFLLPYSIVVRTEYAWNRRGIGQFVLDFGASF